MTLIERLKALSGPCRECDALIAEVFGRKHGHDSDFCNSENGDYWIVEECAPMFTASIDAAMTLVPEGCDSGGTEWNVEKWTTNGVHAEHIRATAWVAGAVRAYAATPAIALCIAALRARP